MAAPVRGRRDVLGALGGPVFWVLVGALAVTIAGLCGDVLGTVNEIVHGR